jgi:PadR family transcriptional regulator PadR
VANEAEGPEGRKSTLREMKRGALELVVLQLLAPGEAYGYEIVSAVTERSRGALEITDGTLYPLLYRLEKAGFVATRWETPERGVPRKYYRLTPAGRQELATLGREWATFSKAMGRLLRNEEGR